MDHVEKHGDSLSETLLRRRHRERRQGQPGGCDLGLRERSFRRVAGVVEGGRYELQRREDPRAFDEVRGGLSRRARASRTASPSFFSNSTFGNA